MKPAKANDTIRIAHNNIRTSKISLNDGPKPLKRTHWAVVDLRGPSIHVLSGPE